MVGAAPSDEARQLGAAGDGQQRPGGIGDGDVQAAAGRCLQAAGAGCVELGEQFAQVGGGDRLSVDLADRRGRSGRGARWGEGGRSRGAGGQEPGGGERVERGEHGQVRGHRRPVLPGAQDQVCGGAGPQHPDRPVVTGGLGGAGVGVDRVPAGPRLRVRHQGAQLAH
ncbi:hypothetical protein, partial [Blastococcus capsensis]|uniref:hypothetical protein n=1 Tax=Blastococcus capsensis TaxID=1564163 RepID=UPI0032B086F6